MDKFYQKPNRRNFVSKELTSLVGYQIKLKKYPWLSLKELHTINYNLCQEIYKVHFSHPQEFTFVITGCQDREKTISLVAKYLGNLPIRKEHPVPPAKVGSTKPGFTIHKTIVNENLKKGRAEVFIYYTGYHSFSLKERIKQGILVKIVEAACFRRLREKESGIYSLYADLYRQKRPVSDEPGWYELQIMFVCNPGISERLIKTTEEEIELLKKNGPEKNDFNAVLDYFKQNGLSSKLNDLMWQTLLLDCYRNKESFDDISDLAAFVESIRPEDIRQIAQEYLIKDRFISYTEISK
jgi:predicted Zn-dependent peptidase